MDVAAIIDALDRGERRVASKHDGEWVVDTEAKEAILEYFRLRKVEPIELGPYSYLDKVPLKRVRPEDGVRVVPPATARYGSYLAEGVVLMPSYVNIGAWVGPRTMVDTWATVGSCAQIGEDGAFIGSRAVVVEGVVVGERAVVAPQVVLSASVPIIDVTGPRPVEYRGEVPPGAVVLPGTRAKEFAAGTYQLSCALIVGQRSTSTDLKTSLNDVLREFEIAV